MIPLFKPYMPKEVDEPLLETLHSGYIGQGKKVEEYEKKFAEYIESPYVVSTNSCTMALTIALRLANVDATSSVLTVPMTCSATNQPILSLGADPIFCDVDCDTGLIDPWDVGQKILFNSRAIMAVDWGGNPVNVAALSYTAERYHMKLIIDAAHSIGAEYEDGSKVGTKGDLVCFSTQAIKTITTIDGGMLVCRSEEDYKRAKLLRWFGIDRESDTAQSNIDVDITEWGYKGHMNDVNATIGIVQLDHIDKLVSAQRTNALYYDVHLSHKYVRSASRSDTNASSAYWLYTILLPEPEFVPRFKEYMTGAGVMVDNVHRRNDEYQLFSAYKRSLPGLDKFASHMICLPVHWGLTASDRAYVVEAANQFAKDEL